jgi:lysophospholipase L1-like esterase
MTPWIRGLLYLVIAVSVAYGFAETWLRSTIHPPPQADAHPFVWPALFRQRFVIAEPVPGLPPQRTTLTASALGVRGDELDVLPGGDDDTFRILTLGGSSTECLLLDDGDAWPAIVQRQLRARTGRAIWVGNAGKSGQNSQDYIVHALALAPAVRADVILVMASANDLQAAIEGHYVPVTLDGGWDAGSAARRIYSRKGPRALARLEPSHTAFWLKRRFGGSELDFGEFYRMMRKRRGAADKLEELEDLDLFAEVYRTNLETLVEATGRHPGTKLVLMTHPAIWKKDMSEAERATLWAGYTCMDCKEPRYYSADVLRAGLERLNATMLSVCEQQSLPCLDLERRVEKTLDHFIDDAHLTGTGSQLVADQVTEFLLGQGILDS